MAAVGVKGLIVTLLHCSAVLAHEPMVITDRLQRMFNIAAHIAKYFT